MEDGENRTVSPADSPESTEASVFQQERAEKESENTVEEQTAVEVSEEKSEEIPESSFDSSDVNAEEDAAGGEEDGNEDFLEDISDEIIAEEIKKAEIGDADVNDVEAVEDDDNLDEMITDGSQSTEELIHALDSYSRELSARQRNNLNVLWETVKSHHKSGAPMRCRIYGIQVAPTLRHDEEAVANGYAISAFSTITGFGDVSMTVKIPFVGMFRDNPIPKIDQRTGEPYDFSKEHDRRVYLARQRNYLRSLLNFGGSEVEVRITGISGSPADDDFEIIGSRVDVLKHEEAQNYISRNGDEPRVASEGKKSFQLARVVFIGNNYVCVNVGGVDTNINLYNLTYRYCTSIEDINEIAPVNSEIPVIITRIAEKEDGKTGEKIHTINASRRRAEPVLTRSIAESLTSEMQLPGVISGISTGANNKNYINIFLDNPGVPAVASKISAASMPRGIHMGDHVNCVVKNVRKNGLVDVVITRLLPSSSVRR